MFRRRDSTGMAGVPRLASCAVRVREVRRTGHERPRGRSSAQPTPMGYEQ